MYTRFDQRYIMVGKSRATESKGYSGACVRHEIFSSRPPALVISGRASAPVGSALPPGPAGPEDPPPHTRTPVVTAVTRRDFGQRLGSGCGAQRLGYGGGDGETAVTRRDFGSDSDTAARPGSPTHAVEESSYGPDRHPRIHVSSPNRAPHFSCRAKQRRSRARARDPAAGRAVGQCRD